MYNLVLVNRILAFKITKCTIFKTYYFNYLIFEKVDFANAHSNCIFFHVKMTTLN